MKSSCRRERLFTALIALVLITLSSAPSPAQIPDEFTNLQVLEDDIPKGELIKTMRGFAGALGVRCNFCHVGDDPNTLVGYDFASDEKSTKKAARLMMKMVRVINDEYIEAVEEFEHEEHEDEHHEDEAEDEHHEDDVQCVTCHRGQVHPELIEDVLAEAYEAGGIDSVAAKYEALRDEYYGRHTFDFGEMVLITLADELAGRDNPAEGLKFLELNAKWFPESANTQVIIGLSYAQMGETETAIEHVERALELDPESFFAKRTLERLKAAEGSDGR